MVEVYEDIFFQCFVLFYKHMLLPHMVNWMTLYQILLIFALALKDVCLY